MIFYSLINLLRTNLRISLANTFNLLCWILWKSRVLCFQLFLILNLVIWRLASRLRWITCNTCSCRTIHMKIRWVIFIFLQVFLIMMVNHVLNLIFIITFLLVYITDHVYVLIILIFTINWTILRALILLNFIIFFKISRIICILITILYLISLIIMIILVILKPVNIILVLLRIIIMIYDLTRLALRFELLRHWII